ncbi:hypothetical protein MKX03_034582 [Papaver bracteatum]|nr:hypothetical protein MKX03_034582 [Papaver bracteatum]
MEPIFLNDIRVTDAFTMEIVEMAHGKVNKHLVSLINKAGATGVGLSGKDGRLLTVRPNINSSELGFVGDIAGVDPSILRSLISSGHIPVVASVVDDENGKAYNINADTVEGELAAAVGAEKLILLTDEIDIKGVRKMVDEGKIYGGMIPKVTCCIRSLA